MSQLRRTLVACLVVGALVALAGCANKDNPSAPNNTGQAMVVHAAPDAPAVDVLLDGNMVGNNLTYPNHTAYLSMPAGTHDVKAVATGTTTTVIDANLPVAAQTTYSVFVNGLTPNVETLVVTDDLTAPATGKAHVRFIHLSPDAPAVDVALVGGGVLFPNLVFREFSTFIPVNAGTVNLEVRQAGTATVVLTVNNVVLEPGKIYTLFAEGLVAGTGTAALGLQSIVNN